jgi:glycosyltransferase involved in cell wall biosynthesis
MANPKRFALAMQQPLAHIGMNAAFLRPRMGGIETYVRRLVPELAALRPDVRFTVFVGPEGARLLVGETLGDNVRVSAHRSLDIPHLRAVAEMTLLGRLARAQKVDLLHSVALTGPLSRATAHVVTIGDLTWMRQPESVARRTAWTWRTFVPRIARRADRVLTYSEDGRRDVADLLGVPLGRIDAVALGPGSEGRATPTPEPQLRARYGLGDGALVLTVAANRANKNAAGLLEAMPELRRRVPDVTLVMAGPPGAAQPELEAQIGRLGLGDAVRFTGHVDEADLEGLYRAAGCLVVPSLHEGFGLPVLEAMRRGAPVACSNASSLPEVAGDAAAYFDPRRPEELAGAVADVLLDRELAQRLVAAGRRRAEAFSWRATAEGTFACFERAWRARGSQDSL